MAPSSGQEDVLSHKREQRWGITVESATPAVLLAGFSALVFLLAATGCGARPQRLTVRLVNGKPQSSRLISPGAYEHYLRARLLIGRGQIAAAITQLRSALAFDEYSPYLHSQLAELLDRSGRQSESRQHLARALELDPNFPDALRLQAHLYQRAGELDQAERAYERCIYSDPHSPDAYLQLAALFETSNRAHRARRVLERLIERREGPQANQALGSLCLRIQDLHCAAIQYRKLLNQAPSMSAMLLLARIEQALGNTDRAVGVLTDMLGRYGANSKALDLVVTALEHFGDHPAVLRLAEALERKPLKPQRLAKLAELMTRLGRAGRAIALIEQIDVRGQSIDVILARALALHAAGHKRAAKALLEPLLVGKDTIAAALRLAQLLQDDGAYEQAISTLRTALGKAPADEALVIAFATALLSADNPTRSVQVLRDALTDKPRNTHIKLALANALERTGHWQDALRLAREVSNQDPRDAAALNFVGFTLADHGVELDQAEKAIHAALALAPLAAPILDSLGWLYFRRGRLAAARQILTTADRLRAHEPAVLAHLAATHAALGQNRRALMLYQQALQLTRDSYLRKRWAACVGKLHATATKNVKP